MEHVKHEVAEVPIGDLVPHEKNPRIDAAQVADLVESIREHGVEVPLVAAPQMGRDTLVVLAGHRRLTACHELGLATVPVDVRPDLVDARDQLAFMATENIHRDQLSAIEESRLFQDMLDLGWSQAQIAKATAVKRADVRDRVSLGKLAEATGEKVHRGQISIDQALVIAEFSDDPDTVAELEQHAGTYSFDWATSRAKARREIRKDIEAAKREIKKRGLRLADSDTAESLLDLWGEDRFVPDNVTDDAEYSDETQAALAAAHADCPGHCWAATTDGPMPCCDQSDERHPEAADREDGQGEPAAARPADPWDELSAEDFAAAAINRLDHLARALPRLDVAATAQAIAVAAVLEMGWGVYSEDEHGIAFLKGITGAQSRAGVKKVLATWPLPVLVYLSYHRYDIKSHQRFQTEGRNGSTYWLPKSPLRALLTLTDYVPSPVEERACELATGHPWAWDGTTDTDEHAEGGDE
ncbi:ParB/RepB/Spo0J family partition protein [Brachybacterium huguangmaarense]|uniref:ParB/RepB/Spo0J family partition protein n=1 Tax=Brachybacterium huguangmaarense TaxID=1652028 RepID=A0ABY6FXY8_9MICO|nr:ParB/RepB/Spo0J family partition protein [Brachybacterium huguangmaarense]UYG15794.1 ParB/RepB/Spo0J family partition protein [Brachybacterium huguangmaarense]